MKKFYNIEPRSDKWRAEAVEVIDKVRKKLYLFISFANGVSEANVVK
jgi:hypothetical protein